MQKNQVSVLKVENLTYAYLDRQPILQDICFQLNSGDRVALIGATGSGKSTLLENIIGLKQPQQGNIWINDTLLEPKSWLRLRRRIGFGFQDAENQLFMPTILEDITFGLRNYGTPTAVAIEKARGLLREFGLEADAKRSVHELSGGQKRLVALAAILALEPDILVLDEPTNGLDPAWRRTLAQILVNLPIQAILIASHDLHWLGKVAQRALILADGSLQLDTDMQTLLQDSQTLAKYGLPLDW